ncbi:MAG: hypothetical protein WKF93_07530 [Acidimicrobiales bacterium]
MNAEPADAVHRLVATRLAGRAAPWADFAAAVVVARGRLLLDGAAFARVLGVHPAVVRRFESGEDAPARAPRRLAALAPELDWPAVGLLPAGDVADMAARHPSAGTAWGAVARAARPEPTGPARSPHD